MMHEAFLIALKKALKTKGLNYKMLAEHLDISEASVKRIFSQGSLSLERISAILEWADLSLLDIARLMDTASLELRQELTVEQEEVLASNSELCAFFHQLLFGKTIRALKRSGSYDVAKIDRFKASLSNLGLAALTAGGELQLLVGRGVRWQPQGPMVKTYGKLLKQEFLNGNFEGNGAYNNFITRSLTPANHIAVKKKIKALVEEIDILTSQDNILASDETEPTSFFFATRTFYFSFAPPKR